MTQKRDPFSPAGILAAPLASIPAAALHLVLWHWDPAQAVGALYMALFLVPLSYFMAFFVGLPYLYLMTRLGIPRLASAAFGGLAVGSVMGFIIGVSLFPLWDWYARFFYLTLGGVCGLAVALTYALILAARRR